MKRVLASLLAFGATACASGGHTTDVTTSTRMTQTIGSARAGGDALRVNAAADGPTIHTTAANVDRVWRVLPAAFDSLGIPVTRVDPKLKIIGTEGLKIRQHLKRVPLSRYLDCGQTQIGPNADSYEVFLVLLVQVKPAPNAADNTQVVTTFEASARPLTFSQGYSRCTTSTTLEKRLLEMINAQLK
jgi:hypothetical protein